MEEVSVTRSVDLEAPAEDVWRALTDPELLADWLEGDVDLDVRPGGGGTIVEPDGVVRRARVDEVVPARRLSLRWWPEDGDGPASTVRLDLEPTDDGDPARRHRDPAGPCPGQGGAGGIRRPGHPLGRPVPPARLPPAWCRRPASCR